MPAREANRERIRIHVQRQAARRGCIETERNAARALVSEDGRHGRHGRHIHPPCHAPVREHARDNDRGRPGPGPGPGPGRFVCRQGLDVGDEHAIAQVVRDDGLERDGRERTQRCTVLRSELEVSHPLRPSQTCSIVQGVSHRLIREHASKLVSREVHGELLLLHATTSARIKSEWRRHQMIA